MNCPLCHARNRSELVRLEEVPIMVNRLMVSPEAASSSPMGSLALVLCEACGHLYNAAFKAESMRYDESYGNALHGSPAYRSHSWHLARMLVKDHHWSHQHLLDIGCGQGYFLRLICALGVNHGIGIDPATPDRSWQRAGAMGGCIRLIQGEFDEAKRDLPGDKVICQHLLEHLPQPQALLAQIGEGAFRERGHELLIEVPNGLFTLRDNGIWDLIHEHVSYFTPRSLVGFLRRSGYTVRFCRESYGRQFITALAHRNGQAASGQGTRHENRGAIARLAHSFEERFRAHLRQWNVAIREWSARGRRLVLWGAGSKGVSFVNLIDEPDRIAALVDQNPLKQGRFVPGTGHIILSPQELSDLGECVILVMNVLYLREVEAALRRFGIQARCVSVMTGPQILSRAAMPALM